MSDWGSPKTHWIVCKKRKLGNEISIHPHLMSYMFPETLLRFQAEQSSILIPGDDNDDNDDDGDDNDHDDNNNCIARNHAILLDISVLFI